MFKNILTPTIRRAFSAAASTKPRFRVGTFNAISPKGFELFDNSSPGTYVVEKLDHEDSEKNLADPQAILIRSHKLKSEDVPQGTYAIARCGAGVNNIPVEDMTARGIVVYNTPGSNANSVKELVLCSLFLASRGIVQGASHVQHRTDTEGFGTAKANVEKDKKLFAGQELAGKTLGVIGLGHIGASVANAALSLGMQVKGHDPHMRLDAAWKIDGTRVERVESLEDLTSSCDYVSLHVPFIPGATDKLISEDLIKSMRPHCSIINFARGELVDTAALRSAVDAGSFKGSYVHDFPDEHMQGHGQNVSLPHLGASTAEAEENSARMGAQELMDFLETGTIRNSVNFPTTVLQSKHQDVLSRWCVVHKNESGVLAKLLSVFAEEDVNIAQQINTSRDTVAYTVLDLSTRVDNAKETKLKILGLDQVLSARVIDETVQLQRILPQRD